MRALLRPSALPLRAGLVLALLLVAAHPLPVAGVVEGVVLDAETGEGLAGANVRVAGAQDFTFINRAAFSGDGGEVRWKKAGSDIIVQIDTDGRAAGPEMEILLKNISTLDAGDFIL